ncbi:MAG: cytochrome bc complex cytochrome b subunit [Thermoplasmatales archaeon]
MPDKSLLELVMNEPKPLPRKVPDYMRSRGGIWYWTGAMVMIAFFYEVATGLILFLYYQPSNAYASTEAILGIPYGSVILTTHLYGAYIMIALVYVHLLRNLFVGAYKKPREMQWVSGVILLILTVAVAYFGYSLSGDVLSSDATDVARGIINGFPFIGSYLSLIILGNGESISLFTRYEGWHIILAGLILVIFAMHFFLAEYNTIMPDPKKGNYKVPALDIEDKDYKPWYPYNLYYMAQIALFTLALIFIIPSVIAITPHVPALFSPFPQVSATSPLASLVPPYPPWFLLFVYKELDFGISGTIGPFWASVLFIGLPLVYLFAIPYIDKSETLKTTKRHLYVSTGVIGVIYLIGLSAWGALYPGVPVSNIVGLLFFVIPMIIVIPIVWYISKIIESGRTKFQNSWKIYVMMVIDGLLSVLAGMAIYSSIASISLFSSISAIILSVLLAIAGLVTYALIYGVRREHTVKKLSPKGHIVFGGLFGFLAVAIISMISVIPPTNSFNQSLYGIGMGILFLIASSFVMLYRSLVYNE